MTHASKPPLRNVKTRMARQRRIAESRLTSTTANPPSRSHAVRTKPEPVWRRKQDGSKGNAVKVRVFVEVSAGVEEGPVWLAGSTLPDHGVTGRVRCGGPPGWSVD